MNENNNIKIVNIKDKRYPKMLRQIDNPPEKLFCIGNLELLNMTAVGVVGSRKCTEYGRQTAMRIGEELGKINVVVVSGMAKGIDNFAHLGALKGEGPTIAVLGCGVDICYPRENANLYEKIKRHGLIVSQYPPGTEPKPYTFPQRNRIIAGLSEGVVVVEAGTNSGALITADLAMNQGKEVFAVPGNINSQCSLGSNKLLVDGARPVSVIDDIIYGMGLEPAAYDEKSEKLGADEALVYSTLKQTGEVSIDQICDILNKDAIFVNGIVSVLEIKGLVAYSLGKVFSVK